MGEPGSTALTTSTRWPARASVWALIAAGLVVAFFTTLALGPYPLSIADMAAVVGDRMTGAAARVDDAAGTVLFSIRLPRACAAILVGAALAAAGAAYQGMLRNPLVSPDILGVSSGAGLGAVLGIFMGLPVYAIQAMAFAGGLAAVGLVTVIAAGLRGRDTVLVLVLAGVVVGALAGAATSLLKVLADPYDQLPAITFWLLGSLSGTTIGDVRSAAPAVILGLVPLFLLRWRINVLSMGDEEARALGVEAGWIRVLVIVCATLVTAAAVAVAGVVGWVGLVIPHIARMLVGPSFGSLLPASIAAGAGYMLLVDTLARTMSAVEVPLGILTAVVGAPVFLWLLARGGKVWS